MASSVTKSLASISLEERQHFPQELIDLLIEHIHQGLEKNEARNALEACTLVSRSFSAKSRKHLLSAIVISERVPDLVGRRSHWSESKSALRQQLESLSCLIESNSDFHTLIRKVHIQVGSQTLFGGSSGLHSVLGALASHATNLETLWITGNKIFPVSWPHSEQLIARPLNNLLSSVKFSHLRISSLSDLSTDILMRCPSVRSFHLVSTTFRKTENASSQSISHPTSLEQLDLQLCINAFHENLSHLNIDLSNLRRLRLQIEDHRDSSSARDLIEGARLSLRSLELQLLVPYQLLIPAHSLPEASIDISRFPKLVNLRLRIHTKMSRVMPSMEEIFVLLTHPTRPTRLRSIEIDLNASVWLPEVPHFFENGDPAWSVLDPDNLREKHPLLQSVSVKLDLRVNLPPRHPGLMREDMARSLKSTILSFILPPSRRSIAAILNVDVIVS
ncbi:hypothetical protein GALMADRAFT_258305 [Galerina marginata CBS 339.88]|uniref:F-box domain-containing protein n=1 Tax=Galerina marginata (strain CBS 339.88) TaxID=685588 RepID=A0A067SBL3_GALM3|nr:hypothetical protein GALMADRAFT_258305 [Galerina marginata CBS 339.88]